MVKDIAQLLQVFGTELAETELPEEPNAIEYLLHSHTDKYRQMKVHTCLTDTPAVCLNISLDTNNNTNTLSFNQCSCMKVVCVCAVEGRAQVTQ